MCVRKRIFRWKGIESWSLAVVQPSLSLTIEKGREIVFRIFLSFQNIFSQSFHNPRSELRNFCLQEEWKNNSVDVMQDGNPQKKLSFSFRKPSILIYSSKPAR